MKWKEYFSRPELKLEFFTTVILLAAVLFSLTHFLNFVEARAGTSLPDPILNLYNPVNLTWLIFGLIYISLLLAVIILVRQPVKLMFALQVYILTVVFRIASMYVMPLNPPVTMIPLNDPFVQFFATGHLLTKDLFFSGHTATLFILFLAAEKKILKTIFLICTIAVGISVLLQHVHYTIDVLAAPFFTYTAYRIIIQLKKRLTLKL